MPHRHPFCPVLLAFAVAGLPAFGATMDEENLAPARRVPLFPDNTTFPGLNEAGLKLFDAAVLRAAGNP